ncbi:hypothetical protein ANCCAN_13849 [Ancylostoma caninum]|uniref:Peptidase M12A domain-containing protein n=1 Tax=Ancylostoma caninum TaxID=29170 RepID=A0A368G778_ANCCA|nr:hypothetical protein ANCCAN_13849 [Ancylostoma caninum]
MHQFYPSLTRKPAIISLYGDDGYYSHAGKLGGYQPLSLESKCEDEIGNAIAEIGHALGL